MQEQPTCIHCGASFDPSISLDGHPKGKRSGRPRRACSKKCLTAHNNANAGDGGVRAWPRSVLIEREICRRYAAGDSCLVLAESYGVNSETMRRVLRRNGVTLRSRNAPTPRKLFRGGRIIDKYGYAAVLIYPDDLLYASLNARGNGGTRSTGSKYVPEHRLVMSRAMGRPVRETESVHHKNGVKDDNRIENLELWTGVHLKGQRVEDLIAFVVEHYPAATRAALDGKQLSLDLF